MVEDFILGRAKAEVEDDENENIQLTQKHEKVHISLVAIQPSTGELLYDDFEVFNF